MTDKKSNLTRRDFIKTSSLATFSLAHTSSIASFLDKAFEDEELQDLIFDYSIDIIRPEDLLFLKFHFVNVDLVNGSVIQRKGGFKKAFAFIKIPSQHIGEELETKIYDVGSRSDFKQKKSFLADHSWLSFELKKESLPLNENQLLEWEENFKLISIDSFAASFADTLSNLPYRTNYANALEQFKKKLNDKKVRLTSLELPYKMFLSPIAEPYESTDNLKRSRGSLIFKDQGYVFRNWNTVIRKPWESQLFFRNIEGEEFHPRFKVVSYDIPDSKDGCVEFLPSPVHRKELHNLTMRPENDRDVLSNYFKLSALGGSTYLKYRNDDPIDWSTVAWEQDVKLARDNYVSITFRAVDVFTGLKLLVSIVSERRYKFGVSFLEKRYFVTYAENEKVYDQDVVISSVPFMKIIPKSPGTYFEPIQKFPQIGKNEDVFLVNKPYKKVYAEKDVIPFEYIGIDKEGKEHQFKLKMAFVPAETYELLTGKYCFNPSVATDFISAPAAISFDKIGFLDPSKEESKKKKEIESSEDSSCPSSNCNFDYSYKLTKSFDDAKRRDSIKESLKLFKKHILGYPSVYQADIDSKVSYAKIDKLREIGVVDKNSSAATFNTKSLILFSEMGDESDGRNYDQQFPLRTILLETNIRISQIDQMEGVSSFRKVNYYNKYFENRCELEEYHHDNQKKLLFQLIKVNSNKDGYDDDSLGGFFTENYKSAGALVNPGIIISNVSVLDQGITYNDSHNLKLANDPIPLNTEKADLLSAANSKVSSISIFGSIDAEIMGISLTDIIGELLPIEDIPVFNYLEKAQDSLKKLGTGYDLLRETIQEYEAQYEQAKALIKNKEQLLKKYTSNVAKPWLESILSKIETLELYKDQLNLYYKNVNDVYIPKDGIKTYVTTTLNEIRHKIFKQHSFLNETEFKNSIHSLLELKNVHSDLKKKIKDAYGNEREIKVSVLFEEGIKNLVSEVVTLNDRLDKAYFKDLVKIYCINKIILNQEILDFTDKILALDKLIEKERKLKSYYKSIQIAFKEANLWSKEYLENERAKLEKQVNEVFEELCSEFDRGTQALNPILQQLTLLPFFRPNEADDIYNIRDAIASANRLVKTYENYAKVYQTLGEENYTKLCQELGIPDKAPKLEDIEKELIEQLKASITAQEITININPPPQAFKDLKSSFLKLKNKLESDIDITTGKRWIKEYSSEVERFKTQLEDIGKEYTGVLRKIDERYHLAKAAIEEAKALAKEWEEKINSFAKDQLKLINQKIEDKKQELIRIGENDPNYKAALSFLNELKELRDKLREASHQKFNYTHTTKNFRKASLGGIIEFIPGDTELNIDVNYEIQLDIDQIDRPPTIAKQDYYTKSTLTDFKLGLLKLLAVDFDKVSFVTGSTVKDDFSVEIRDVQFAGPLSFVKAFQDYLSSINDNLVFDISTSYAKVGYSFAIPDFTAGYFNFFNFNLSAQMTLPFDPKKSLQLAFGFGSEESKFGITVAGVFGGQGYFNIIAEPKRGIVGMVLVLEFGAIFNLDLFVARGTAYLVGGIFIKRYLNEFELRGYILCVGRFDVLGIFSASITFYLGLEGNSEVLYGQCVAMASKRFSRFYTLRVKCRMRKKVKGGDKQSADSSSKSAIAKSNKSTNLMTSDFTGTEAEASKSYFASYIA